MCLRARCVTVGVTWAFHTNTSNVVVLLLLHACMRPLVRWCGAVRAQSRVHTAAGDSPAAPLLLSHQLSPMYKPGQMGECTLVCCPAGVLCAMCWCAKFCACTHTHSLCYADTTVHLHLHSRAYRIGSRHTMSVGVVLASLRQCFEHLHVPYF